MPCPSPFERTPERSPKRSAALVPLGSDHADWERFQLERKEIRDVWGVFSQAPWVDLRPWEEQGHPAARGVPSRAPCVP